MSNSDPDSMTDIPVGATLERTDGTSQPISTVAHTALVDADASATDAAKPSDSCEGHPSEPVTAADAMLKRLRLRRSADATANEPEQVERNEQGLVTRVRRSILKGKSTVEMAPQRPMFATVCMNNVNRSMSAECVLADAGLRVCSFGAGSKVSFPGRTASTPRVFGFSTTYEDMYNTLRREDEPLHRRNGVLQMLERNIQRKPRPNRWHALRNKELVNIDVVLCLDYEMFINVLNDLQMRIRFCFQKKQLHVICLEVEDTPDDAVSGSVLALELCQEIEQLKERSQDMVKDTVVRFEQKHQLSMFYIGLTI